MIGGDDDASWRRVCETWPNMMKEASEKNVAKFEIREQSDQLPCPDFARILLSNRLGQDSAGKQKSQEPLWFLTFTGSGAWI